MFRNLWTQCRGSSARAPPKTRDVPKAVFHTLPGILAPVRPPTEPWSPVGQTGVGVPAGRGGGGAGERAVGGGVGRVGVARSNPEGGRLRFAGLRGHLLHSGQSEEMGHVASRSPPRAQAGRHHPQVQLEQRGLLRADGTPWPSRLAGHEPEIRPTCTGPRVAGLGPWVFGASQRSPYSDPGPPASAGRAPAPWALPWLGPSCARSRGPKMPRGCPALTAATGRALAEARTCPGKGGRLPVHATWLWFSCREIWDMFWPVEDDDWMSFTPGTWTTDELALWEKHTLKASLAVKCTM